MNSEDRLRIRINYMKLITSIVFDDIRDDFVAENIFNEQHLQKIASYDSEEEKMRCLVRELLKGGPGAYQVFCRVLNENGYSHLVDDLNCMDINQAKPSVTSTDESDTEDDYLRLKSNYKLLVDHIRYCDVRDLLYQNGALNDDDVEKLDLMTSKPEKERVRALLKIIMDRKCYSSFVEAMKEHVCYSHIVEKLIKTDLNEARKKFFKSVLGTEKSMDKVVSNNADTTIMKKVDWKEVFMIVSEDRSCIQNWKRFRTLPNLQESDIFSIAETCARDGPRECLYQVLMCWLQKSGHQASLDQLIQTMDRLKLRSAIGQIRQKFAC